MEGDYSLYNTLYLMPSGVEGLKPPKSPLDLGWVSDPLVIK